jgi:hypothetical protein
VFESEDVCKIPENFLFGTVVVRVVDRRTGAPLAGVRVGIADSPETAGRPG